jgi:hypothetical protein
MRRASTGPAAEGTIDKAVAQAVQAVQAVQADGLIDLGHAGDNVGPGKQ